jgi:phosphate transport system permease protein
MSTVPTSNADGPMRSAGHALSKKFRPGEFVVESFLFLAAASSVLITAGIVWILVKESYLFFTKVSLWTFISDTSWAPEFENASFGILPLVSGTIMTTLVALCFAIPVGTITAVWLSEYAPFKIREWLKPALELLAAVPTVVFGYFALSVVSPGLQWLFLRVGIEIPAFNMLSAGLVMGLMIVPYVASLSEDAMRAVPAHLREAAYAMGCTRVQVAWKVVFPAALSGITAAFILAVSRALGETMVVAIAAGNNRSFTFNPTEPAQTITAFIVQITHGDVEHGHVAYESIFAAGLTLMLMTLVFNVAGFWLRKKYREAY